MSVIFTPLTDSEFIDGLNYYFGTIPTKPAGHETADIGLFSDATRTYISTWNTINVTNMSAIFFEKTTFNEDISSWDVTSVSDMTGMFSSASAFNQNINSWDMSSVKNTQSMFKSATSFNQDLNSWDMSSVTNMNNMFEGATLFNGNISSWDTSSVLNMSTMFSNATLFNQNIGSWDVSQVTDISNMFSGSLPTTFDQDIGSWDTSSVLNMFQVFANATPGGSAFNQNIAGWNTSSVGNMAAMFANASYFNQDIRTWTVGNTTALTLMFFGATAMNTQYNPTTGTTPDPDYADTPSLNFFNEPPICFIGSVNVLMSNGYWKMIKDIRPGDEVVEDIETNKISKVARVYKKHLHEGKMYLLKKELFPQMTNHIICTNHPIWVVNDTKRVFPSNIYTEEHSVVSAFINDVVYDLQFETEGTFYVNGLKVDSLSPRFPSFILPYEMYENKNNYTDNKFTGEDDKWRNKPSMLDILIL